MSNEVDKELSQKYCRRFGKIAVEKAFVSSEEIKKALSEQVDDDIAGRPHRLLGRILMDKGLMNPQQIDSVMNELFKNE